MRLQLPKRPRGWWTAAVLVVVGLGWTAGGGGAAGAAERAAAVAATSEELVVSGPFSATGTFEPTTDCPSFHTVHTGDGSWTGLGDVTFVLDYCVALGSEPTSPLSGTIAITATAGSLAGTVEGSVSNIAGPGGYPAQYTATITGGTGAYEAATGTLELAGVWDDPEIAAYAMHGTISGTVTRSAPPLPHPTSLRDCLHGGWRNFADDDGEPFDGPLHCILYVITHRR